MKGLSLFLGQWGHRRRFGAAYVVRGHWTEARARRPGSSPHVRNGARRGDRPTGMDWEYILEREPTGLANIG